MGVYLLHTLVIRLLGHFVSFADPFWGSGMAFVVVLVTSLGIIAFLKKCLPKTFNLLCAV